MLPTSGTTIRKLHEKSKLSNQARFFFPNLLLSISVMWTNDSLRRVFLSDWWSVPRYYSAVAHLNQSSKCSIFKDVSFFLDIRWKAWLFQILFYLYQLEPFLSYTSDHYFAKRVDLQWIFLFPCIVYKL